MSMNTARLTISMPFYLYQHVKSHSKKTGVSQFITRAVEDAVIKVKHEAAVDPIADFIQLADRLPRVPSIEIFKAINRGRE